MEAVRWKATVVAVNNNIHNRERLYAYLLVEQVNVCNNKLDISLFNNANQRFDPGNLDPAVATHSTKAGDMLDTINVNTTVVVN